MNLTQNRKVNFVAMGRGSGREEMVGKESKKDQDVIWECTNSPTMYLLYIRVIF